MCVFTYVPLKKDENNREGDNVSVLSERERGGTALVGPILLKKSLYCQRKQTKNELLMSIPYKKTRMANIAPSSLEQY